MKAAKRMKEMRTRHVRTGQADKASPYKSSPTKARPQQSSPTKASPKKSSPPTASPKKSSPNKPALETSSPMKILVTPLSSKNVCHVKTPVKPVSKALSPKGLGSGTAFWNGRIALCTLGGEELEHIDIRQECPDKGQESRVIADFLGPEGIVSKIVSHTVWKHTSLTKMLEKTEKNIVFRSWDISKKKERGIQEREEGSIGIAKKVKYTYLYK